VRRLRITIWIIVVVAACAALGGWAGSHLDDGNFGMVALIGATCGVLGSFLPGGVLRVLHRVRRPGSTGPGTA